MSMTEKNNDEELQDLKYLILARLSSGIIIIGENDIRNKKIINPYIIDIRVTRDQAGILILPPFILDNFNVQDGTYIPYEKVEIFSEPTDRIKDEYLKQVAEMEGKITVVKNKILFN